MHSEPVAANRFARSYTLGPFTVVEVSGEIDMASAGSVAAHLEAVTDRPAPDVLVDLRPVVFFDCSGLRVLCRAETRARERGGRLRLVSDRPHIHHLLRAAGLLTRFQLLPELPSLDWRGDETMEASTDGPPPDRKGRHV
ncbi:STAS domain-containing protein, partial [Streptomyces chiangmaiensis]